MTINRRNAVRLILSSLALGLPEHAVGQPKGQLQFIVATGPGTATDFVARTLQQPLEQSLDRTVVIENRAGANGTIAGAYVKSAPADGSVVWFPTSTMLSAAPFVMKQLPYDPVKDFTPISMLGKFRFILVVNKATPARTLAEFIAYAKGKNLSFGSGGSPGFVLASQLNTLKGLGSLHVSSWRAGESQVITALLRNDVQWAVVTTTLAVPQIKAGELFPLAMMTGNHSRLLPAIPTIGELGMKEFIPLESWGGVFGPRELPKSVVENLGTAIRTAIARVPEQSFEHLDFTPESSTPDALRTFLKAQLQAWKTVTEKSGIEPQ